MVLTTIDGRLVRLVKREPVEYFAILAEEFAGGPALNLPGQQYFEWEA